MQDSVVRLERASKSFALPEGGSVTALDGVDLAVGRNEFLTLLGPSGCGKTTLLHAISGFVDLDAGRILLDGVDVTRLPPYRRPVNTVFQNYALFPHMSVGDNAGYALDVSGIGRDERQRRVAAALRMVGLEGFENRRPRQLSGGQQQRVALARAIVARPKLLLLDEPLSALDRNLRQAMQLELKTLQHELGISFIFVTHDQEEALTMSDRVAVLDRGVIQQLDTPRAIYDRPANAFVATFVGASNLFAGRLDGHRVITGDGEVICVDDPGRGVPEVQALIRPERFTLAGEGPGLDVTVDRIVFLGAAFELLARTASGRRVTAEIPAGQQALIGALAQAGRARLHYDPAAVHLIRDVPAGAAA